MQTTVGIGGFDNDAARQFVTELQATTDLSLVRLTMAVAGAGGRLGFTSGARGIAAAEVVAAAQGFPVGSLPPEVANWIAANNPIVAPADLTNAEVVVAQVMGDDSEVCEYWSASTLAAWQSEMAGLRARLR